MGVLLLTGGEQMLVDDADLHLFAGRRWFVLRIGDRHAYAMSGSSHKKERLLAHRVIAQPPIGLVVDHINGDGLDNRRENLRVCTRAENMRNRRTHRNGASGFKGVYRDGDAWRADIGSASHGQSASRTPRRRLGRFKTAEAAAAAYDIAAVLIYGEFACLNFPHVFPEVSSRKA